MNEVWGICQRCKSTTSKETNLCSECLSIIAMNTITNENQNENLDPFEAETEPAEEVLIAAIEEEEENFRKLCEKETGSLDLFAQQITEDLEAEE